LLGLWIDEAERAIEPAFNIPDVSFGLGSSLETKRTAKKLPSDFAERLTDVNKRIVSGKLPEDVLDAMSKATADLGRRRTRHRFLMERLGLVSAK
jgi:hypothetical protein